MTLPSRKDVYKRQDRLLEFKREELNDVIVQCMGAIHQASKGDFKARDLIDKADTYFSQQKEKVRSYQSLALLDGLIPPMLQYKDSMVGKIETALEPPKPVEMCIRDRQYIMCCLFFYLLGANCQFPAVQS